MRARGRGLIAAGREAFLLQLCCTLSFPYPKPARTAGNGACPG